MRSLGRSPALGRLLLPLLAAGWSCFWLLEALQRVQLERVYLMTWGPFWEAELIGQLRAAMDWQTPLALAALPLALWGARQAARAFAHPKKTQAAVLK